MRLFSVLVLLAIFPLISGDAVCAEEVAAGVPQNRASGQIVTVELIQAHREYQLAKLRMSGAVTPAASATSLNLPSPLLRYRRLGPTFET